MKRYIWIFLLVAASCHQPVETMVRVQLKPEYAGKVVELTTVDSVYKTIADSLAEAVFCLPEQLTPGYGTCYFERNWIPVYVEPGKSFEMAFEVDSMYFIGEGSRINNYLNSSFFRDEQISYESEEEDFMTQLQERLATALEHLDTTDFSECFKQTEKKRLHYDVYSKMNDYSYWHARLKQLSRYKTSGRFAEFYSAVAKEEDALVVWGEYRRFFQGLVSVMGEQGAEYKNRVQLLRDRLNYIDQYIQGPRLAAYLTDLFMTDHLSNFGVDGWEDLVAFYDAKVSDTTKRNAFRDLYATWANLAKGQPSPSFEFPDINGKQVSLNDLAGKYVYIDVWATWCYFCCKEFPALRELEEKFAGKNIHFVGISCDKDQSEWKKKVLEEKLGGIQLNTGEEYKAFKNAYLISGIPHFILLDREGKILDANMTRPSDPETVKVLSALPGI